MADETQNPTPDVTPDEQSSAPDESPVEVTVHTDDVPAQVTGPAHDEPTTVSVHETTVTVDRVITDTSDPLAVQVPPEGRGDATTPIAAAYGSAAETPEQSLARKAREAEQS